MADPATKADIDRLLAATRDLADGVRDLATAQAAGAEARESQRQEGQARGETVVAQIATHHSTTLATLSELVRRTDALERAKGGAPYPLVYVLILAIIVQGGVVLHLYGQANGQDASAAFGDVTHTVESLQPGAAPTEPK